MKKNGITPALLKKGGTIVCRTSEGVDVRATPQKLSRYSVAFEVYNPYSILQLSEVLGDFEITVDDRTVYSGRGVVSKLVNMGSFIVCEASLEEDSWLAVDLFTPTDQPETLHSQFTEFLQDWQKVHSVLPQFKVLVADMNTMLNDLQRWLEQVELGIQASAYGDRVRVEREIIETIEQPIVSNVTSFFERIEAITDPIEPDLQPIHRNYMRRQIHPLVLCAPFVYRSFRKPLGYAGDYEMINMMLRDPLRGSSLFSKLVNLAFLSQPPVLSCRNRIKILTKHLVQETDRVARAGRRAKIFNVACGPAAEVENFLAEYDLCEQADFTLLDFNDETLQHVNSVLRDVKMGYQRQTRIDLVNQSVQRLLKESGPKHQVFNESYDFIYCAGLFDYLSDRVCKRLMNIFYEALAPGGLVLATNFGATKPFMHSMEYLLEWHLLIRDKTYMSRLAPSEAPPGAVNIYTDPTGVNVFLEARKP